MDNIEIRLHGKGGQGAVSAAEMLVAAFTEEGKHAAGFPFFGSERRGAPTTAFVRFGPNPIREKTKIYTPHCLFVFDQNQITTPNIYSGLKENAVLVANTNNLLEKTPHKNVKVMGTVDATPIAIQELGIPAVSTAMLGCFSASTQWVSKDSILSILPQYFDGKLLDKNIKCVERGFDETEIKKSP